MLLYSVKIKQYIQGAYPVYIYNTMERVRASFFKEFSSISRCQDSSHIQEKTSNKNTILNVFVSLWVQTLHKVFPFHP